MVIWVSRYHLNVLEKLGYICFQNVSDIIMHFGIWAYAVVMECLVCFIFENYAWFNLL